MMKHAVTAPLKSRPYSLDELVALGVDASEARKCLVDSRYAKPEALRVKRGSPKMTEPTLDYAWGPDVNFLLGLDGRR